jgi:hypothetical protein
MGLAYAERLAESIKAKFNLLDGFDRIINATSVEVSISSQSCLPFRHIFFLMVLDDDDAVVYSGGRIRCQAGRHIRPSGNGSKGG